MIDSCIRAETRNIFTSVLSLQDDNLQTNVNRFFFWILQIINDQRESNKRKSEKDYDLDLDMGRAKKQRRTGHNGDRDNPNYNAFQEHQNRYQRGSQHHRRGSSNFNKYAYRIQFINKRKYWDAELLLFSALNFCRANEWECVCLPSRMEELLDL